METLTMGDTIKTITSRYIDGSFVESHGREVIDIIKPTSGQVIACVTLADEEDTRHAIAQLRAHSPVLAGRPRKSAQRSCAGCMKPLGHALTI
jgi:acyl-CoA reductase-like NAD-dependent aldehyde dehydrogenase